MIIGENCEDCGMEHKKHAEECEEIAGKHREEHMKTEEERGCYEICEMKKKKGEEMEISAEATYKMEMHTSEETSESNITT